MKKIFLLVLFPLFLYGQDDIFLIKTFEDYKTSQFVIMNHVSIEKRIRKDIYWRSDYQISAPDKKLLSLIEKEYWGLFKGDSLFVNCELQGICSGFAYTEQIGNHLFLLVPDYFRENISVLSSTAFFGV